LDNHKLIGSVTNISGHGVAIDTQSHHGFSSSKPLGMFDTQTMQKICTESAPQAASATPPAGTKAPSGGRGGRGGPGYLDVLFVGR
jgi:hypothetical protein